MAVILVAMAGWLPACASQTPAPAGWQPQPGSGGWMRGAQRYSYAKKPFQGALQDLASQEAVNVVLRRRGVKFRSSDPFPACPGRAAVATFDAPGQILQEAFSVQSGEAVVITYVRPLGSPTDPDAAAAMERTLCSNIL